MYCACVCLHVWTSIIEEHRHYSLCICTWQWFLFDLGFVQKKISKWMGRKWGDWEKIRQEKITRNFIFKLSLTNFLKIPPYIKDLIKITPTQKSSQQKTCLSNKFNLLKQFLPPNIQIGHYLICLKEPNSISLIIIYLRLGDVISIGI